MRLTQRHRRWLLVATAASSALVMILTIVAAGIFGQLNGNIATQSMSALGKAPPPSKAGVLNILALGSQTRDGQGPGFGTDPGTDLSDTAMLIHLSADHSHVIVVSIPRDLLVDRPACTERVGGNAIVPAARNAMFDSAMNLGGPACAVATVEAMSGIRVDHFIRLDFNGFRTMTDAVGGVQVCVPPPGIHDWRSHLDISAGLHVISGDEALAFVRDRHAIGGGGDLPRIQMQQMFVSSLIKKIMSNGTLTDPVTLYRLANAATGALTTDPGLASVQALIGLGETLRGVKLSNITFVTLPNATDRTNADRLVPTSATDAVYRLLRADQPWTGKLPSQPHTERAGSTSSPSPSSASSPRAGGSAQAPASAQSRNASENICAGLPTPNNLGELGK